MNRIQESQNLKGKNQADKAHELIQSYEQQAQKKETLSKEILNLKRIHEASFVSLEKRNQQIKDEAATIKKWASSVKQARADLENRLSSTDLSLRSLPQTTLEMVRAVENLGCTIKNSYEVNYAANQLSLLTTQYLEKYAGYREARRIVSGFLKIIDHPDLFISDPAKYMEEAYLKSTDYWLSNAGCAVVFRYMAEKISNSAIEKESWLRKAERAEGLALCINPTASSQFFLLWDIASGQTNDADKRCSEYISFLRENGLDESLRFILQARFTGALSENCKSIRELENYLSAMKDKEKNDHPNYEQDIISRTMEYAEKFPIPDSGQYALLKSYCPEQYQQMKGLLMAARKNMAIYAFFEKALMRTEKQQSSYRAEFTHKAHDVLTRLICERTDNEQRLLESASYYGCVIETHGDTEKAKAAFNAHKGKGSDRKYLSDILFQWCISGNDEVDPHVKYFAIRHLGDFLAKGFAEYAESYRKKYRTFSNDDNEQREFDQLKTNNKAETICQTTDGDAIRNETNRYLIQIDNWKGRYKTSEEKLAEVSIRKHLMSHFPIMVASDSHAMFSLGVAVISLIVLILSIKIAILSVVLMAALMTIVGITAFCLSVHAVRMDLFQDAEENALILSSVLEQLARWEEEFLCADEWNEKLTQMLREYAQDIE